MFQQILEKLGLRDTSEVTTRRKYARHSGVQTEVVVNGKIYSVHDWSMGGVFFETQPDSRMIVGDAIKVDIKFRLPTETITITQTAYVVRSARKGIAAMFDSVTPDVKKRFEKVIDSFHAQSFLESQVA